MIARRKRRAERPQAAARTSVRNAREGEAR
jgi:hypothetical protein